MIEGLFYSHDFLSGFEELELRQHLDRLSFYQDTFRGQMLRRKYSQFGFRYGSTGRALAPAAPFPDFLTSLSQRARVHCGATESINQCIVSRYDAGDGIGWHTDARRFGECIIGISLGGPARFQFRNNEVICAQFELTLCSGSLYSMSGSAR